MADTTTAINPNYTAGMVGNIWNVDPAKINPADVNQIKDTDVNQATATLATAATRSPLDASTETTYGQMQKITQQDSPWMQMARTNAQQQMNARGLINSSMAIGEGEKAAYQAALPIATQDANAYKSVGDMNFKAQQDTGLHNASLGTQTNQFNTGQKNSVLQSNNEQLNKAVFANLDAATKTNLAELEASYETLTRTQGFAADAWKQMVNNITDIQNNTNLTPAAKDAAIKEQMAMGTKGAQFYGAIAGFKLDDILRYDGSSGAISVNNNTTTTGGGNAGTGNTGTGNTGAGTVTDKPGDTNFQPDPILTKDPAQLTEEEKAKLPEAQQKANLHGLLTGWASIPATRRSFEASKYLTSALKQSGVPLQIQAGKKMTANPEVAFYNSVITSVNNLYTKGAIPSVDRIRSEVTKRLAEARTKGYTKTYETLLQFVEPM